MGLKRKLAIIGLGLLGLSVTVALTVLWWWAIAGIRQEIGTAAGITAVILITAAFGFLCISDDLKED